MLKQRILTAVVLIPLVFSLFLFGEPQWVQWFFFGCSLMSVYEMASMVLPTLENSPKSLWAVLFCVILGGVLFWVSVSGAGPRGELILGFVFILIAGIFSKKRIDQAVLRTAGFILSIAYGSLPWICVWDLYLMGPSYLIFTLSIVMLSDTGAYFAGRKYGKHPLAPNLSPKKTWEGFFGGILACSLGSLVFSLFLGNPWTMLSAGIIGGIGGVLGDLIESAFKRFAGVKDSGQVFPGHGGFLDRADSVLIASPVIWFILHT